MNAAAKAAQTLALADGGGTGNVLKRELFPVILLNKGNHGLDAVLRDAFDGAGRHFCILKLFKEKKPDLGKYIPRLEFCVLLFLQQGGTAQKFQELLLACVCSAEFQKLQVLILEDRFQIFCREYAFKMAAQKGGMEKVGIYNTGLAFLGRSQGAENIGINKKSFTFLKDTALIGCGKYGSAAYNIIKFQFLMPVPGNPGVCQVYMVEGVRIFGCQTFDLFGLIFPDSDFHSCSYFNKKWVNLAIYLYFIAIFIYFICKFVIIIIVKKGEEVKGELKIFFETFEKLKRFAAQNPEKLEELTEEGLAYWMNRKSEVKRDDSNDNSGSFLVHDGPLCV